MICLHFQLGDDPDPQLNDGLKAYIEAIKKNIPNLQIALFIPATHFIFYADCSKKLHTCKCLLSSLSKKI